MLAKIRMFAPSVEPRSRNPAPGADPPVVATPKERRMIDFIRWPRAMARFAGSKLWRPNRFNRGAQEDICNGMGTKGFSLRCPTKPLKSSRLGRRWSKAVVGFPRTYGGPSLFLARSPFRAKNLNTAPLAKRGGGAFEDRGKLVFRAGKTGKTKRRHKHASGSEGFWVCNGFLYFVLLEI